MDYGRDLEFGISLVPERRRRGPDPRAGDGRRRGGHRAPRDPGPPLPAPLPRPWTLLSFLAARTERLRLFPDVANLPLRLPGVLAKSAASLDRLSGGRAELGLGAGAFWEGIKAMGGPVRTPGGGLGARGGDPDHAPGLERGARRLLRGRALPAQRPAPGPPPVHPIEIWLGAYKPRMLALTGRLADGWLPSLGNLPVSDIPAAASASTLRRARPGATRRTSAGCSTSRARSPTASGARGRSTARRTRVAEVLVGLATEHGFDTFIFWPGDPSADQIQRFATDVMPAVRDAVARAPAPETASCGHLGIARRRAAVDDGAMPESTRPSAWGPLAAGARLSLGATKLALRPATAVIGVTTNLLGRGALAGLDLLLASSQADQAVNRVLESPSAERTVRTPRSAARSWTSPRASSCARRSSSAWSRR